MQFARELGADIERGWLARNHELGAFPDVASDVLTSAAPAKRFELDAFWSWLFTTDALPAQVGPASGWGAPGVTLYRNERFYIEALVWADGTTAIHDHSFAGAFSVLAGSSLHCRYELASVSAVSEDVELGTLDRTGAELLGRGDVRRILPGRRMVHSLFHLNSPSVSLVARTFDSGGGAQWRYEPGARRLDRHGTSTCVATREGTGVSTTALLQRQAAAMGTLYRLGHPDAARRALGVLGAASPRVFVALAFALRGLQSREAFADLMGEASAVHGELARTMVGVAEQKQREADVFRRRALCRDPAERLRLGFELAGVERGELR